MSYRYRSRATRLCGIEGAEHAVDGKGGKNHPAPRRHRTATAGYAHRDRQTGAHPEWATVPAGSQWLTPNGLTRFQVHSSDEPPWWIYTWNAQR